MLVSYTGSDGKAQPVAAVAVMGRVGTVESLKDILQLILRYRRAPCGHGQPCTVVSASCQRDLHRRTWGGVLLRVIQVNACRLL